MIEKIVQAGVRRFHRRKELSRLSEQFWRIIERQNRHIALLGKRGAISELLDFADGEQRKRVRHAISPRRPGARLASLMAPADSPESGVDLVVILQQSGKEWLYEEARNILQGKIPVCLLYDDLLTGRLHNLERGSLEAPDWPKSTYVVASSRRTGSTLLCGLLRKTGMLGNPEEYIADRLHVLTERKAVQAGKIIDQAMKLNQSPNGCFGIKIHWSTLERFNLGAYHSLSPEEKERFGRLLANSRYVWLTRRNKLRQSISDWRARHTGVFHLNANDKARVRLRVQSRVPYNYDELKLHLMNFLRNDRGWAGYFQSHAIVPCEVEYEELTSNPRETVARVAEFLGVPSPNGDMTSNSDRLADEFTEEIYRRFTSDLCREFGPEIVDELGDEPKTPAPAPLVRASGQDRGRRHVLVTLATESHLAMAKQFFASAFYNASWDGDYLLLAHDIPGEALGWFRDRGILIHHCAPLYQGRPGGMHASLATKFYMFTPAFRRWDTVIYSDVDAIVRGPLDELKGVRGFCAVEDWSPTLGEQIVNGMDIEERGLSREECLALRASVAKQYRLSRRPFCAGFFAFSTDIIEAHTFDALRRTMDRCHTISKFGDQLAFNFHFYANWVKLKPTFNVLVRQEEYKDPFEDNFKAETRWGLVKDVDAYILHLFNPKPWDPDSVFYLEWRANLRKADGIDLSRVPPLDASRLENIARTGQRIAWKNRFYAAVEILGPYKTPVIGVLHFVYWRFVFAARVSAYLGGQAVSWMRNRLGRRAA